MRLVRLLMMLSIWTTSVYGFPAPQLSEENEVPLKNADQQSHHPDLSDVLHAGALGLTIGASGIFFLWKRNALLKTKIQGLQSEAQDRETRLQSQREADRHRRRKISAEISSLEKEIRKYELELESVKAQGHSRFSRFREILAHIDAFEPDLQSCIYREVTRSELNKKGYFRGIEWNNIVKHCNGDPKFYLADTDLVISTPEELRHLKIRPPQGDPNMNFAGTDLPELRRKPGSTQSAVEQGWNLSSAELANTFKQAVKGVGLKLISSNVRPLPLPAAPVGGMKMPLIAG